MSTNRITIIPSLNCYLDRVPAWVFRQHGEDAIAAVARGIAKRSGAKVIKAKRIDYVVIDERYPGVVIRFETDRDAAYEVTLRESVVRACERVARVELQRPVGPTNSLEADLA